MSLTSPGVEVSVIDESQYIPSAVNTVPYFLVATAQNKVSGDGVSVAAGTTAANANKTYLITSQRDLVSTFGVPFFYSTTTGTAINGYELNEYGLLAAYSALGVTNRAYIQRVDVNLTELAASLGRPTGEPTNNTYWLDLSNSRWGIQEWDSATNTFTTKTPMVITDTADVVDYAGDDYTPIASLGSIGDYAVVVLPTATIPYIQGFYKNSSNAWVLIGTDEWRTSWPTVSGTATPSSLSNGANLYINDTLVTVGSGASALTVAGFATVINDAAIAGVTAAAVDGALVIYADSDATNDGSTGGCGIVAIDAGPNSGTALLAALGISAGEYNAPIYYPAYSYQSPRWRSTDTTPRPSGSIWHNMSSVNNGINLTLKKYNSTLSEWVAQDTNAYSSGLTAITAIDSTGGKSVTAGTTVLNWNRINYQYTFDVFAVEILERLIIGATEVTGTTAPTGTPFTAGNSFTISASAPGTNTLNTGTVTIGGTGTVADFISAVSSANVPYVSASVNGAGNIVITHSQGGEIYLDPVTGTPLTTAGFTVDTSKVSLSPSTASQLVLSNWVSYNLFTYTASDAAVDTDPTDGTLWYYSTPSEVDIMIQDNGQWYGYQNVTNDVRGFDLSLTNASGPIISASEPTTQNDSAESPLQYGDLWIDSSDLENYPMIYRWESVDSVDQWVALNTADQITENGVLFADARWATNGTTDPITDDIPTIESLLTSNYLDIDAPDPTLYPQGMLLWNTRRSGYNVKQYQSNWFNAQRYPDEVLPTVKATWVTASGNKDNGSMWAGRLAQRQIIVQALKAGLDTSEAAREEQNAFSLIATPGYPELIPNMIALSNERNNTLFVVGDTPLRLAANGNDLTEWATNNNGVGLSTEDGQSSTSNYCATFYPSCQTTDLSGTTVVAPASHMMVRTILRSDSVSYPWLAPAGTRRGVVDNASSIGYIDAASGEFQQIAVSESLRDVLYERNVNPITFIPGVGITNFGNKTSTTTTTALDRINVARLVAFLRGRLEDIGKLYLFEPNDENTRNEITNTCNSLMIDMVAKRAIYDYLVVCDLSNNTPARIDRNELWVDIAIEPVKSVEFIYIPLRIKNTGEITTG